MDKIEKSGRKGDSYMAHLAPGEIVIPRQIAESTEIKGVLSDLFESEGANINEFTVGSKENKKNPETGYLEFFFLFHKPKPPPDPIAVKNAYEKIKDTPFAKNFLGRLMTGIYERYEKKGYYPAPPTPRSVSPMVAEEAKKRVRNPRKGRASTMLTSQLASRNPYELKSLLG